METSPPLSPSPCLRRGGISKIRRTGGEVVVGWVVPPLVFDLEAQTRMAGLPNNKKIVGQAYPSPTYDFLHFFRG